MAFNDAFLRSGKKNQHIEPIQRHNHLIRWKVSRIFIETSLQKPWRSVSVIFFIESLKREASIQAFQPDTVLSFCSVVKGQQTRAGIMNMRFSKHLNLVLYCPSVQPSKVSEHEQELWTSGFPNGSLVVFPFCSVKSENLITPRIESFIFSSSLRLNAKYWEVLCTYRDTHAFRGVELVRNADHGHSQ
jgi:hypothetical protein